MKDKKEKDNSPENKTNVYKAPKGQEKSSSVNLGRKILNYKVSADWILIRKKEKPIADVFFTYYSLKRSKSKKPRPVTFIFNGGPGASSAYLHVGALGPQVVSFGDRGESLAPPAQLKQNKETWLDFTDLVFVDPVGTGFSRSLEEVDLSPPGVKKKNNQDVKSFGQEFYKLNRDLEIIGEFIQNFLSKYRRWSSPVYVAGESYGGFRVAKLARKLQEDYGVGLNGVILISPCLELNALSPSDYGSLYWVESFPTMAATAVYHKKSTFFKGKERGMQPGKNLRTFLKPAEDFALNEMNNLLIQGEGMDLKKRQALLKKIGGFLGVSFEKINKGGGRLPFWQFCRLLLQKDRKWCGMYDTSATSYDPFPDRDSFEGPDPTLSGIEPVFASGINSLLREELELECERQYRLLNTIVNRSWKQDEESHFFDLQIGATDDLRYAMALNPNMKVFVCHGVFDLVTPYFSSQRVIQSMNLPTELKKNISFQIYHGGHMFYTWKYSRELFKSHMKKFFSATVIPAKSLPLA